MASEEPPYLTIGTDVSAKYKGAFCEAKVKKVNRVVKCKVTFKNNLGTFMVTDDQIKGPLRVGSDVDAKHPEKNQFSEAIINKLQDYSQYTVVFDDGDETTLRRTSLCLKSGRHFAESPTLDQFPLTNPEHFGTPVIGSSKSKRKRRSTMASSMDYESSDEESVPKKVKAIRDKEQNQDLCRVVCVDFGDRRKKENWYPGLIVPAQPSNKMSKDEHLVRSFKDGKYYQVPKRDIRDFSKDSRDIQKVENNTLRSGIEKAINFLEKDELPPHWDKALFSSLESPSADEDSRDSDSDTSDDEPSEEKDRFVAQLYKFMDERGTPINKAPSVSNRDLNLYKLFKIMHKLGGYNKVTNKNKWKVVYTKMGLPISNMNGPTQIKVAYKRFLQSFEDFYRKLGCTMVSNSRSTRGRHRSDRNFIVTRTTRERETTSSPKGRTSAKEKIEKKTEEKRVIDKKEIKQEIKEEPKSPEKKRSEKINTESKEDRRREEKLKPGRPAAKVEKKEKGKEVLEKARTREDARKEKNESPEKKGTRASSKAELIKKEDKQIVDDKVKMKEKSVREKKPPKERKTSDGTIKEKREIPIKEKKEPVIKDKNDSKEDKTKVKKEESKVIEEKSPKKKIIKEKKEEKVIPKVKDEKPEIPEEIPISDAVPVKEEKPAKVEVLVKKEDKDKSRPKLRDRKEDSIPCVDEGGPESTDDVSEKDTSSRDGSERKAAACKLKGEDADETPPKVPISKRKFLKSEDKEEKESLQGLSDSDGDETNDSDKQNGVKHNEIEIGDRVKVKYGRGRLQKVYEAKVLKIEPDGPEKRFYVHYAGWNTRYDEWVRKNFIVSNLSAKLKSENSKQASLSPASTSKKIDRGRPPGAPNNARKNSIGSRSTRSETRTSSSPLSRGLEPKRRSRKKSVTATSQDSDTDGMEIEEEDTISRREEVKEELFSDDDEKEKPELLKGDQDITDLEKAISSLEESVDCMTTGSEEKSILDESTQEDSVKVKLPPPEENTQSSASKKSVGEIKAEVDFDVGKHELSSSKFPVVSLSEVKVDKLSGSGLCGTSTSASTPTTSVSSFSVAKIVPEDVPKAEEEIKATLSFAGLIKSVIEKSIPLNDSTSKEKLTLSLNASEKIITEKKKMSDIFSKSSSLFDEDLSDSSNKFPVPKEGTSKPKTASELFDSIIKDEIENNSFHVSTDSEVKSKTKVTDSFESNTQGNIGLFISASSESSKEESLNENKMLMPPEKCRNIIIDRSDSKSKGGFQVSQPVTSVSQATESIFTFPFSSLQKESLPSDTSFKRLHISPERIKPKISETVDVSKVIPGILERLKKDVVADVSESPPPPKEELNFDFLIASNSRNKSLSRSESSSSLKICESDTNDSNTESKNLVPRSKNMEPILIPDASMLVSVNEESSDKTFREIPASSISLSPYSSSSNLSNVKKEVRADNSKQATLVTDKVSAIDPAEINVSSQESAVSEVVVDQEPTTNKEYQEVKLRGDETVKEESPCHLFASSSSESLSFSGTANQNTFRSTREQKSLDSKDKITTLFDDLKNSTFGTSSVIKSISDVIDRKNETESSPSLEESDVSSEKDKKSTDLKFVSDLPSIQSENSRSENTEVAEIDSKISLTTTADDSSFSSKKEMKRKKFGKKISRRCSSFDASEKDDFKSKEGKNKTKKRLKLDSDYDKHKGLELKPKSKKLKKNKNKKRFMRLEDQYSEHLKKLDFGDDDDNKERVSDKIKRKERKRSDKKFFKSNLKGEDFEGKSELSKKKKSKKNRDKFFSDKKDYFEKKTKKKRKSHIEDNQDTDSEKESLTKIIDKKRKRKKFKVKECSSSDEGITSHKLYKEKSNKDGASSLWQDSKSDDPDMSFLLCEEKVPASPGQNSSDSSSNEDASRSMDLLPSMYPGCSNEPSSNLHKHTILDNTPPTTPSSTESLLSSSPSHERDAHYPESTQSESDLFHHATNRVVSRGSEEYHAATTLAFAVGKPIKEDKSKRKKKRTQRHSESSNKSPKHTSFPRLSKVNTYCESSGSPTYENTSALTSLASRSSASSSKYFALAISEKDPEKRISILIEQMDMLRKRYVSLRAEVFSIDHKRRKARKKKRESAGTNSNQTVPSEDIPNCS